METKDKNSQVSNLKITSSVVLLTIRNILLQATSIIGFAILSFFLSVKEIGLFGVVSEVVGILGYFSDIGLAAALIQKKEKVSEKELRTVFSIQQILGALGITIAICIYINRSHTNSYTTNEHLIFASLIFGFFCASLKTIPSVLLEREMNFKLLGTIDVVENITFYLVASIGAILGLGTLSYAIAITLRSILGLIIIYRQQTWPIGFDLDKDSIKKLFRFGIPFQVNSFIAIAKDRFSNIFLAESLGSYSFGLLLWAIKINRSVIGIMDAFVRVMFPALSRVQNNIAAIKNILHKATWSIAIICFPLLLIANQTVPILVDLFPQYQKWNEALWIVPWISISMAIAAITTPLTNAFSAIGKIKTNTKYMIMWLTLTWILYPYLTTKYGIQGSVTAILLVGASSLIVWLDIYSEFKVNVFRIITPITISSLVSYFLSYLLQSMYLKPLFSITIFSILIYLLDNKNINWAYTIIFKKNEK